MNITIDIAQVITALAALLGAAGSFATVLIGLRNHKISRSNATGIAETKVKVEEVRDATNGLAARTEASAMSTGMAEGNLQGRIEQTAERKAERDQ